MSVNKVMLIGRLGKDPELKYTPSGAGVCNFSIATSESWMDKSGQKQERTEWHRIVVWGKLAELSNQYLAKGRQCFVEGKLQTRSWEDQQGNKKYTTEILANTIQFLGGAQANQSQGQSAGQGYNMDQSQPAGSDYQNVETDSNFAADDIPF